MTETEPLVEMLAHLLPSYNHSNRESLSQPDGHIVPERHNIFLSPCLLKVFFVGSWHHLILPKVCVQYSLLKEGKRCVLYNNVYDIKTFLNLKILM